MTEFMRLAAGILFVFSVIFIWMMLLYQFVLTVGGFLWRRAWSREVQGPAPPAAWPGSRSGTRPQRRGSHRRPPSTIFCGWTIRRERLEIIIINDGSTDRTAGLVRQAQQGLSPGTGCSIFREARADGERAPC